MNVKATAMCFLPMEIAFQPHKTIHLKTECLVHCLSLNLPLLLQQKRGNTGNLQASPDVNIHGNFGISSHTKGKYFQRWATHVQTQ